MFPSLRRLKYLLLHMTLLLFTLSAMICLLASILFLLSPPTIRSHSLRQNAEYYLGSYLPSYAQPEHSGWGEINDPDRMRKGDWDLFYHLGGNGPWIEKKHETEEGSIAVPEGCTVDQVHMMSRHGERYPTKGAGGRMVDLLARIRDFNAPFTGPLFFLNSYNYITDSPNIHFEQLTTTGPYSGTLQAFTTGIKLSTRYQHLWNNTAPVHTLLWAGDSSRVISTAQHFAAGFFGLNSNDAEVVVISEGPDLGGDTLTPGETCLAYIEDQAHGHDLGYVMRDNFSATYLPAIAERLMQYAPASFPAFTNSEVFSMQETCGFDILVRGGSPWCSLFTVEEWEAFEYARDIIHFYRAGPGTKYAKSMGWLWLNATMNLIEEGPESAGPLYFSFVHDGDIVPMLAALGLFEDEEQPGTGQRMLPIHAGAEKEDWVVARKWRTSTITPMGGRVLFERMTCGREAEQQGVFVRFNVNDGIVPLEACHDGPGGSCEMRRLRAWLNKRGEEAGEFREVCGLKKEAAEGVTFLRQPAFARRGTE